MYRATFVIVTILLGLVVIAALLWHAPIDQQAERAGAAPPSQSFPIGSDLHDGQETATGGPSVTSRASVSPPPGSVVVPTEISHSREKRAGVESRVVAESAAPSVAIVRATLADAIKIHLPDLALSDNELDDLADATLRMRVARERLRFLPKTREQASRRDVARRSLEEAIAQFTHIVEMTPGEFTRHVQPGVGIDEPAPDDEPLDISIRRLTRGDELE